MRRGGQKRVGPCDSVFIFLPCQGSGSGQLWGTRPGPSFLATDQWKGQRKAIQVVPKSARDGKASLNQEKEKAVTSSRILDQGSFPWELLKKWARVECRPVERKVRVSTECLDASNGLKRLKGPVELLMRQKVPCVSSEFVSHSLTWGEKLVFSATPKLSPPMGPTAGQGGR